MPTGPQVILALKIAVAAVTVLLLASLVALAMGRQRLHGRINTVFFLITIAALIVFEGLTQLDAEVSQYNKSLGTRLYVHLCFAVPSALLMPVMLYTGWTGRRRVHLALAWVFGVLWAGTFVTGVLFLQ